MSDTCTASTIARRSWWFSKDARERERLRKVLVFKRQRENEDITIFYREAPNNTSDRYSQRNKNVHSQWRWIAARLVLYFFFNRDVIPLARLHIRLCEIGHSVYTLIYIYSRRLYINAFFAISTRIQQRFITEIANRAILYFIRWFLRAYSVQRIYVYKSRMMLRYIPNGIAKANALIMASREIAASLTRLFR